MYKHYSYPITPRGDKHPTSLYPCILQQTGKENTQTYQIEVPFLIQHQILVTYAQGNL